MAQSQSPNERRIVPHERIKKDHSELCAALKIRPAGLSNSGQRSYCPRDLPLNFHPFETGALRVDAPIGAGGATDSRAELSDRAAWLSVAVNRRSANALGV